jgi:pseudouridine kinase
VARNVAENLARLGASAALFSIVGMDESGAALIEHAKGAGIDVRYVLRDPHRVTSEYAAILQPDGDLALGVSDMEAVEAMRVSDLAQHWDAFSESRWLFVECNVPADVLAWCIERSRTSRFQLAIDAVSEPKAQRLPDDLTGIDLLVLNEREAAAYLREKEHDSSERSALDRAQALRDRGAHAVILTRGVQGLVVHGETHTEIAAAPAECVDATGAGDALTAATIFRLLRGDGIQEAARIGSRCAALTVETPHTVRPDLHERLLALQ